MCHPKLWLPQSSVLGAHPAATGGPVLFHYWACGHRPGQATIQRRNDVLGACLDRGGGAGTDGGAGVGIGAGVGVGAATIIIGSRSEIR